MSRKTQKFDNQQAQIAEHQRMEKPIALIEQSDPVAAAEAAHVALMTSPDAPEWARVTVKPTTLPLTSRADVVAALASLDAEEAELRAKLEKSIEAKRAIYNQQLADQAAAEEKLVAARELPNNLKAALKGVQEFVPADAPVIEVDQYEADVKRGQDALAIAMRRLRGEDIPEPERTEHTRPEPKVSSRKAELLARIEPSMEIARAMKLKIEEWSKAFGSAVDSFYVVGEDDAAHEHALVDDLMRGLPSTTAELQSKSYQLVTGVLKAARMAVQQKNTLSTTLDGEMRNLQSLLDRVDRMGPMVWQGDKSAAHYDLERELQPTLMALGTVNADSVKGLWDIAADMTKKLQRITELRESVKGQPQPTLQWDNAGGRVLDDLAAARRMERVDWQGGNATANANYSPFDAPGRN